MTEDLVHVGHLIRQAREKRGWTQSELATKLATSQSAVNRIERGGQNLTLRMLGRVAEALDSSLVTMGAPSGPISLRVEGGTPLSGSIDVNTSKNGSVALLCASLLTKGRTTLRRLARIEEVNRILEVLTSIGVQYRWIGDDNDLEITPPEHLDLDNLDVEAARVTRSIILLFGPLIHDRDKFRLPHAGGCDLGSRTVEPHLVALRPFGVYVDTTTDSYEVTVVDVAHRDRSIVLTERGDTVTENALMAAARSPELTVIRNASSNYMVQELCYFLERLGVEIGGIGTPTLTVRGLADITADVDYSLAEDPIEAMTLLTAAIVTHSTVTIRRVPIEFLEIELAFLSEMNLQYELSAEYPARNGRTRLVDLTTRPSELSAPMDKIHPMPFPGINIDNLPFFAVIGAVAVGETLIHDWVYENRAIYLTELSRLGANVRLFDPHRLGVRGPTNWRAAELMCPPALRPAVVILLAMLATPGVSTLRNVYVIDRGHHDLADRLNSINACISSIQPS